MALTFFLVANPIGNSPAILSLVKELPFERQKKILLRESLIALVLALFFQYSGHTFLTALGITDYAVPLCGGTILFITALKMIFSLDTGAQPVLKVQQPEPMIVPIATPLISGPGLLSIIMLQAQSAASSISVTTAILMAWIGVTAVLTGAPYIQRAIGRRGMVALEQLMGMALSMMSMDMIVNGAALFMKSIKH